MKEKTEEKYEEFKKLGQELGVPVFETFLEVEVIDPDGNIVDEEKRHSHTWNRNFYNFLLSFGMEKDVDQATFGAGSLSAKDTGGNVRYGDKPGLLYYNASHDARSSTYGLLANAGVSNMGIVVGSGAVAESFEHHSLATLITSGSGAGSLDYAQSNLHSISYTAGTKTWADELIRYFNNNSGGTVTVNEVGIYSGAVVNTSAYKFMFSRDKLASSKTLADGAQLKVTYTISLVYPG